MTVVKLFLVEVEMLERFRAFGVIPGVGQQHAADIPKNCADSLTRSFLVWSF